MPDVPPDVDAILHAGDISNDGDLSEFGQWAKLQSAPVYAVRGNHDVGAFPVRLADCCTDVTGRAVRLGPSLLLAGIGSDLPAHRIGDLPTEEDVRHCASRACRRAAEVRQPSDRLVLLTHFPPYLPSATGWHEPVRGFFYEAVAEASETVSPVLIIHGHVHALFGCSITADLGGSRSTILCPGPEGRCISI